MNPTCPIRSHSCCTRYAHHYTGMAAFVGLVMEPLDEEESLEELLEAAAVDGSLEKLPNAAIIEGSLEEPLAVADNDSLALFSSLSLAALSR